MRILGSMVDVRGSAALAVRLWTEGGHVVAVLVAPCIDRLALEGIHRVALKARCHARLARSQLPRPRRCCRGRRIRGTVWGM